MRYKNRGSMTEIVGYFSNEQKAKDFEEAFRRFIRGAVIDDRDARGRAI